MANTSGTKGRDDIRTGTTGQAGATAGGMTGGGAADKARDMASGAVESARDMASNVADTARDWASSAGQRVADAASSVAGTVRENLPTDTLNKAGEYVSDAWDSSARYFQESGFRGVADDVAGIIRRNPIPALLVGIGIGFLLARSTRS